MNYDDWKLMTPEEERSFDEQEEEEKDEVLLQFNEMKRQEDDSKRKNFPIRKKRGRSNFCNPGTCEKE